MNADLRSVAQGDDGVEWLGRIEGTKGNPDQAPIFEHTQFLFRHVHMKAHPIAHLPLVEKLASLRVVQSTAEPSVRALRGVKGRRLTQEKENKPRRRHKDEKLLQ